MGLVKKPVVSTFNYMSLHLPFLTAPAKGIPCSFRSVPSGADETGFPPRVFPCLSKSSALSFQMCQIVTAFLEICEHSRPKSIRIAVYCEGQLHVLTSKGAASVQPDSRNSVQSQLSCKRSALVPNDPSFCTLLGRLDTLISVSLPLDLSRFVLRLDQSQVVSRRNTHVLFSFGPLLSLCKIAWAHCNRCSYNMSSGCYFE